MQFHSLSQRVGVDTPFKTAPEGLRDKKHLAHLFLVVLSLSTSGLSQLHGQEYAPEDVLKKIKLANEEGRSINSVSLDCKWFDKHSYAFPKIKIERLGSKISFTGDSYLFDPKTKDHINGASPNQISWNPTPIHAWSLAIFVKRVSSQTCGSGLACLRLLLDSFF